MKKFNLIIFSLFVCIASGYAQIEGDDDFGQKPKTATTNSGQSQKGKMISVKTKHYNYELSVGPRVGIGFSTMSEGDGLAIYDGLGFAFGGGIAANIRFGGKDSRGRELDGQGLFGVGLELNYESPAVKTKAGETLRLSYFEVPVLFQVYPCYNTKQLKNLYLEVGATFAAALASSPDNIYYQNVTYATGNLKGSDIKPTFGVGYRFNKNSANDGLYVSARYSLGVSKLAGNFPGKMSSAEITIGYLFKCIGTKKK